MVDISESYSKRWGYSLNVITSLKIEMILEVHFKIVTGSAELISYDEEIVTYSESRTLKDCLL